MRYWGVIAADKGIWRFSEVLAFKQSNFQRSEDDLFEGRVAGLAYDFPARKQIVSLILLRTKFFIGSYRQGHTDHLLTAFDRSALKYLSLKVPPLTERVLYEWTKNKPSIALLQPPYPCFLPDLGDSVGASRTGLS